MADPTLKDVLHAIDALASRTKADFARVEGRLARVEENMERVEENLERVEENLEDVQERIAAHRVETKKGFSDLDNELTRHAAVHREIEKDITTLKRRPPRTAARPPRRR